MSKLRDKLRDTIAWQYSQHKKDKCEICGKDDGGRRDENGYLITRGRKLTVHHIDEDITNNSPNNLQTLCRECHDKKHNL